MAQDGNTCQKVASPAMQANKYSLKYPGILFSVIYVLRTCFVAPR